MLLRSIFVTLIFFGSVHGDEDPVTDFINNDFTSNDFLIKNVSSLSRISFKNAAGFVSDVFVDQFPALEGQSSSLSFTHLRPCSVNVPHTHPRASEFHVVFQGTLTVTFIGTNKNQVRSFIVNNGDAFVIPRGLLHFEQNVGREDVFAVAYYNSQDPGTLGINTGTRGLPRRILGSTFGVYDDAKLDTLFKKKQTGRLESDPRCRQFFDANPSKPIFNPDESFLSSFNLGEGLEF